MAASLKNVSLQYFDIRGRAEPIRLLLNDAGVEFSDNLVTPENRAQYAEKKFDYSLYPFNQLPVLTIDGEVLAQQDAILRYVCKVIGQAGRGNIKEDLRADMLGCAVEDLNRAYTGAVYSPNSLELLLKFLSENVPKSFKQYEYLLETAPTKSGYFVYSEPCFVEYTLYYLCTAFLALKPTLLEDYKVLAPWFEKMSSRPGIKVYMASGKLLENFNGTPAGNKVIC